MPHQKTTPRCFADIQDPRLQVIRNAQNLGVAQSINHGMAIATAPLVARYDGDDVWQPHALERLADALDAHPAAVVAYGDVQTINQHGELGDRLHSHTDQQPRSAAVFEPLLVQHFTCAPAMLFRRDAWRKVLPWPEQFKSGLGDWYFNLKFAQMGPFVYLPERLALYRVHDQGMHTHYMQSAVGEANTRAILAEFLPLADESKLGQSRRQVRDRHLMAIAAGYRFIGKLSDARRLWLEVARSSPILLFKAPFSPQQFRRYCSVGITRRSNSACAEGLKTQLNQSRCNRYNRASRQADPIRLTQL
ncbi:glycosyltransferase [bacterium]|nr:glycosyltransferase [bacterium]